jgi:hypothetical protein
MSETKMAKTTSCACAVRTAIGAVAPTLSQLPAVRRME